MRWALAFLFALSAGVISGIPLAVDNTRSPNGWLLWTIIVALFAILGAVIGGASDILDALRMNRHHRGGSGHRHGDDPPRPD
jgi:hypothetical protein